MIRRCIPRFRKEFSRFPINDEWIFWFSVYVNHRPAFGLNPDDLTWAFQTLGHSKSDDNEDQMERGYLLDLLQSKGQSSSIFSKENRNYCFSLQFSFCVFMLIQFGHSTEKCLSTIFLVFKTKRPCFVVFP